MNTPRNFVNNTPQVISDNDSGIFVFKLFYYDWFQILTVQTRWKLTEKRKKRQPNSSSKRENKRLLNAERYFATKGKKQFNGWLEIIIKF